MPPIKFQNYRFQENFLLGAALFFVVLSFFFALPFLATLFAAGMTAVSIYPLHKIIQQWIKFSNSVASFVTFMLIIILFLIPLTFFILSIIGQAYSAYDHMRIALQNLDAEPSFDISVFDRFPYLHAWAESFLKNNPFSVENIANTATDIVRSISAFLIEHTANIIKQISIVIIHLIIFLVALFYFIRDGQNFIKYIKTLIPLDMSHKNALFVRIENAMNSIVFGMFGGALAQGIVLGIGFGILGIQNSIFWAALGALLSPIPYVGSAIIWIPLSVYFLISGEIVSAVFLILWAVLLVANIDNVLKPYIIGSKATLHPLAVMIMILGGALMFGLKGIILGPIILTLTIAFLHIYKTDYQHILGK